ncbi:CUB domain-containing protein [Caerostris darwini]|uniref:CUB domain-containing protein n=1 Tax=Caerostris darwini TaxID=1538125 RepID=A0AAV4TSE2_9ARAC|nr:CUB domain-containing protein [Caerostris darwini]
MKLFTIVFLVFGCQISKVLCNNCQIEKSLSGTISHSGNSDSNEKCWMIPVTAGKFIRIQINSVDSQVSSCSDAFVSFSVPETSEEYKTCPGDSNTIVSLGSVTVKQYIVYYSYTLSFNLSYTIKDIECINKDSFRCDDNSCVPSSKVCDGVKDCSNGADEVGCEAINTDDIFSKYYHIFCSLNNHIWTKRFHIDKRSEQRGQFSAFKIRLFYHNKHPNWRRLFHVINDHLGGIQFGYAKYCNLQIYTEYLLSFAVA